MEHGGNVLFYVLVAFVLGVLVSMLCARLFRGKGPGRAVDRQAAEETRATPVVVSVAPGRDESKEVAAAIAAAVYAVVGAHRLVYIGEAHPTFSWTSELRSRLHTSHAPRLGPR